MRHATLTALALALVSVLGSARLADAAQNRWNGKGNSGIWKDPDNWSQKRVPTVDDDVVIPGNARTIVVKGPDSKESAQFLRGGSIELRANGNLIIREGVRLQGGHGAAGSVPDLGARTPAHHGGEILLSGKTTLVEAGARLLGGQAGQHVTGHRARGGAVIVKSSLDCGKVTFYGEAIGATGFKSAGARSSSSAEI